MGRQEVGHGIEIINSKILYMGGKNQRDNES